YRRREDTVTALHGKVPLRPCAGGDLYQVAHSFNLLPFNLDDNIATLELYLACSGPGFDLGYPDATLAHNIEAEHVSDSWREIGDTRPRKGVATTDCRFFCGRVFGRRNERDRRFAQLPIAQIGDLGLPSQSLGCEAVADGLRVFHIKT